MISHDDGNIRPRPPEPTQTRYIAHLRSNDLTSQNRQLILEKIYLQYINRIFRGSCQPSAGGLPVGTAA